MRTDKLTDRQTRARLGHYVCIVSVTRLIWACPLKELLELGLFESLAGIQENLCVSIQSTTNPRARVNCYFMRGHICVICGGYAEQKKN